MFFFFVLFFFSSLLFSLVCNELQLNENKKPTTTTTAKENKTATTKTKKRSEGESVFLPVLMVIRLCLLHPVKLFYFLFNFFQWAPILINQVALYQPTFSPKSKLKLQRISVIPKWSRSTALDFTDVFGFDCIPMVVLVNNGFEHSFILASLFKMFFKKSFWRSHSCKVS